ncbi:peptidylprolyl isomerase [bacterium]|nr:peptidylprolyl isomerase [bacterium]
MAKNNQQKQHVTKKHLARKQREERQTRIILLITLVVGALVIGLIIYGVVEQKIIRPNKVIAQVGDDTITVSEFEKRVKYTRLQMLDQAYTYYQYYQAFGEMGGSFLQTAQSLVSQLENPVLLGEQILEEMIGDLIIRQEAAARGITVSEEEVEQALQAAFRFFPDGTPTPTLTATLQATPTYSKTQLSLYPATSTPTETSTPTQTPDVTATPNEATETALATEETNVEETDAETEALDPTETAVPTITSTPTPYTTEIYGEDLQNIDDIYSDYNFSVNDLREIYETDLLQEKLQAQLTEDMEPVEEQVWARHILVETEEEAQEVLDKLNEGEDWTALAAEYSTDESNKDAGGDLGWFNETTMVAPFTEAAFGMDVGEISDPIQTDFGYHIIQVLGKREAQVPADQFEQNKTAELNAWVAEQRDTRDDITIADNWDRFVPTTPIVPESVKLAIFPQQ